MTKKLLRKFFLLLVLAVFGFVVIREIAVYNVKKYIFPDYIAIVAIVSNAEDFKKELFSDQTVIEYPSGVDAAALKEGDDKIKAFDLKIKPEDVSVVKVSELFK